MDVYSDWSGPCSAMTNFLKKVKLEVNDDLLSYAMAKTDKIPQLKLFKGHCKPIWLFLASGTIMPPDILPDKFKGNVDVM